MTCGFCREPARTVDIYAAATGVDDKNKGTVVSERPNREGLTAVRKLEGLFDRLEYERDLMTGGSELESRGNPAIGDLIKTYAPPVRADDGTNSA